MNGRQSSMGIAQGASGTTPRQIAWTLMRTNSS